MPKTNFVISGAKVHLRGRKKPVVVTLPQGCNRVLQSDSWLSFQDRDNNIIWGCPRDLVAYLESQLKEFTPDSQEQ